MPRFFVDRNNIEENKIIIGGADAHHIARSLRMAEGDEAIVCDGEGGEYRCIFRRAQQRALRFVRLFHTLLLLFFEITSLIVPFYALSGEKMKKIFDVDKTKKRAKWVKNGENRRLLKRKSK